VLYLRTRRVETHADPIGGEAPGYREVRSFGLDEAVPLVLDGRPVAERAVAALLPAAPRS
jgi:hypothetical protein